MTKLTIGSALKHARESAGISVFQAARETRIRVDFLQAMERDNFRFISGAPYVRGLLRTYAAWLDLDTEAIVQEFDRAHRVQETAALGVLAKEPAQAAPRSRERLWVTAAVVAASLLLLLSLVNIISPPTTRVAEPPAPPTPKSSESETSTQPTPEQLAQVPQGVKVTVTVTGDRCWVRVVADGNENQPLHSGTLQNGAVETFEASSSLKVTFGALRAVGITVNGRDLGSPPGTGDYATFVFYPDTTSFQRV